MEEKYSYERMKSYVLTDEGQRAFLRIRDRVQYLLREAGAFKISTLWWGLTGDVWEMTACVDRLLELEEVREITNPHESRGSSRVFIGPKEKAGT